MATQPIPSADRLNADDGWRAYHVFYHGDQDRLLRELVRPLVARLLAAGQVERFFFIRYALGGPHVRLRWRGGDPATAEAALERAAAGFFAHWPSTESLPEEEVRRVNHSLLGVDPLVRPEDDVVDPDNSWRPAPLGFEVERYGGPALFGHSLELFALSSARALELLETSPAPGRFRAQVLRLLAGFAWGLADSEEEFVELAGYGVRFLGEALRPCVEQGDQIFERQREALDELLCTELETLAADAPAAGSEAFSTSLAGAGRWLAERIRHKPGGERWVIGAGHLHMTANRLGVLNPEEVYLSRMLERAARDLAAARSERWRSLWTARRRWAARVAERSIHDYLHPALGRLQP